MVTENEEAKKVRAIPEPELLRREILVVHDGTIDSVLKVESRMRGA